MAVRSHGFSGFLVALLLTLGHYRLAAAETASFLTVERGPSADDCPNAATLSARLANIRGREPVSAQAAYSVAFERDGDEFVAVIRGGPNGENSRSLRAHGSNCRALAQATAVTLALLLDADTPREAEPKPEPKPEPKAEPKPLVEPAQALPPRASAVRIDSTLSLGASALFGVLRPIAPAFSAETGVQIGRWRMGLGVLWNPPQELSLGPGTLTESLLSGTARTCFALARSGPLRFDGCSGLFAGTIRAQARGFTRNDRRSRPWLAVPVELSLANLSGNVGWELSAAALGSLAREDFAIDGLGVPYSSPRIAGIVTLRVVGLLDW